jgi:hypothetical protein
MRRATIDISSEVLDAVRSAAEEQGRDERELVEDAVRFYLLASMPGRREETFDEILDSVAEWQRARGVEALSEEEAIKLAVEEQHAARRGE